MAKPKNKSNRKKGAVAGMSTTVCCIVLLMVVVGGFIGYNYMTGGSLWGAPVTPPPDNGSVPQVNNTLPVTTAPEDDDGGEDDPLYYIFGFSSKVAHLSSYIFYLLIIFISFKIIKLIFNIKIAQYSILILSLNNHLSNITRILYEDSIYIALILIIY